MATKQYSFQNWRGDWFQAVRKSALIYALFWAGAFIWAGLVFLTAALGYLPAIGTAGPWNWAFFGAGALALILTLVRVVAPAFGRAKTFHFVFAGFLLIIGVGGAIALPLILTLVGVAVLVGTLVAARYTRLAKEHSQVRTEEKNAREGSSTPSEEVSCKEMMHKMMGECRCGGMMERMRPAERPIREETSEAQTPHKA